MARLGEQLHALRDRWTPTGTLADPSAFEEQVTEPLGDVLARVLEVFEVREERVREERDRAREAHSQAEQLLAESLDPEVLHALRDDLRDVSRGVFTFEEVMRKWEIE